jgi:2-oxoglutarate ferredoxin oxidoreductase subunit delta
MVGKILINEELCKGCKLCADACPLRLIRIANHINSKGYHPAEFVDPKGMCTGCTLCALTCPEVAIEAYREERKKVEVER